MTVWPVSDRWDPALRGAARPGARATIYPPQGAPFEARLLSWSVTADRTAQVRRTVQAVLDPDTTRGLSGVTVTGAYLQLDVGLDYLDGSVELIPQGLFRIDSEDTQRPDGGIAITGYGREKVIEDDKFTVPRTAAGATAVELITALLQESIPGVVVDVRTSRDVTITRTTWETERWGAIDGDDASLARSLGVEVWADGRGRFVISDVPSLADPPVWSVDAGAGGVLVSAASSTSVEGVYNVVVASGDASNGTAPIGPVIVQDGNSNSPTWVGGPFGRRVRHYSSPLILSVPQADAAARSMLANSLGQTKGLSFSSVPNPALEPGDVVTVLGDGDVPELHIIDRIGLSSSSPMSCDTRSTQFDDGSM